MTLDTFLNLLGLAISLGGLVAAGINRQLALAIFASALITTTGVALFLTYDHERELSRVDAELKSRLGPNQWTLERIRLEMNNPDPKVLAEVLSRATNNGSVKDKPAQCVTNQGDVLFDLPPI